MKQTAVEWLFKNIWLNPPENLLKIIDQAKEMEKQQIIKFANYCVELQYKSFQTGEDINAESMDELLEQFKNK
jgi:hypothetical protein